MQKGCMFQNNLKIFEKQPICASEVDSLPYTDISQLFQPTATVANSW